MGRGLYYVVPAEPSEDDGHHYEDMPSAHADRTAGRPPRGPSRLRLQFLDQFRGVGMPRMDVVQMADQILGSHRHVADRTMVHALHDDSRSQSQEEVTVSSYLGMMRTTDELTR